jgi:hypothetical protein
MRAFHPDTYFRSDTKGRPTVASAHTLTPGRHGPEQCHNAPGSSAEEAACSCGLTRDDRLGQAYNEEAFHYFLTIERKRSKRSGLPFLVLLVDLKKEGGASGRIDNPVARTLFSGLRRCLRGTDFVGWYRAGRVIGAVLVDLQAGTRAEMSRLVRQRFFEILPADLACLLRLRACHKPALRKLTSDRPTLGRS